MTVADRQFEYETSTESPGIYRPLNTTFKVPAGAFYSIDVTSSDASAFASGFTPSTIHIDSIRVSIPSTPVSAVLLDTLSLGLDSLSISLNAIEGYIYPVEVSIFWKPDPSSSTESDWLESRLEPVSDFSSTIVDFFLLPTQVFPESRALQTGNDQLTWSGVYAVPVLSENK